jgi:uncharacterized membrane protein YsdA (DUF1294 family)/cold shock CspA family protein
MRYQGKITNWKDEKGVGFITPNGGGSQVFVHIKSFENRKRRPVGNEIITYELKTDARGRSQAGSVAFAAEPVAPATSSGRSNVSLIFTTAFLIFVAGASYAGRLPFPVLGLYLVASSVAFAAYGLDKAAARRGRWRTQETTLHFLALIGGWPGALTAQRLFRHNSKKQTFQIAFWATVVINCCGFGWLFSSGGANALRSILGVG